MMVMMTVVIVMMGTIVVVVVILVALAASIVAPFRVQQLLELAMVEEDPPAPRIGRSRCRCARRCASRRDISDKSGSLSQPFDPPG
jgi:hypothetical protein